MILKPNKKLIKIENQFLAKILNNSKIIYFKESASKNTTLLHYAAKYGHLEIVKLLLENGADANTKDKDRNNTPLHWATKNNNLEMVQLLLSKNAVVISNNVAQQPIDFCKDENIKKIFLEKQTKVVNLLGENQPSTSGYKSNLPKM